MFKNNKDMFPITIILSVSLLDFYLFFKIKSTIVVLLYYLIMITPRGYICAWNHHHQHCFVFKNNYLNRILEFFYTLHTGICGYGWVLHHNLGHHKNYLDQSKDTSKWIDNNGNIMGFLKYTAYNSIMVYPNCINVGKLYPKILKRFYISMGVCLLFITILYWYNAINCLFIFIIPMITSLIITVGATYKHHSGMGLDNVFNSCRNDYNNINNIFTGNIGYHTAHHNKMSLHWSLLKEEHERIKDKIIND